MSTATPEKTEIGMLSIPDETGDTRIMWDPSNKDERATAKAAFEAAQQKGMAAFMVNPDSGERTGEIIREFPKKAGKIIMVRQLVGG